MKLATGKNTEPDLDDIIETKVYNIIGTIEDEIMIVRTKVGNL